MRKKMEGNIFLFICSIALCSCIYIAQEECPPNEEFLLCGSPCPFNCTKPDGPVTCNDNICVEGCFCKSGFLRNENGTCVSADKCGDLSGNGAAICAANEEFLSCGTACPGTCAQPEPLICGLACSMGCFCKAGYVRDTASGKCVTLDKCPSVNCSTESEVYSMCNGQCESTCEDQQPICTFVCSGGCVCAPGLVRNSIGACVTPDKCQTKNNSNNTIIDHLQAMKELLEMKFF